MIGRYKLLQPIGEGGFGSVWMAEQREPVKRRVALKIIKLGMDTKQVIARFEAERQALAMMDHPNIAKVFDAGETETGRPYFVMEHIKGVSIVEYCDVQKLDTTARLLLFTQVCNAIQHAHQKGIIHRDIKPSNVLVTLGDGPAGSGGRAGAPWPKVIDFGIAKATNTELTTRTLFTEHRQMVGTPAYMSPEQAEMTGIDIDTRSDIYSLGVLLYELLVGATPFDTESLAQAGFAEMMRVIREEEPQKPSTRLSSLGETAHRTARQRRADARELGLRLRGDLDWIVMKCLEKDRTRRYDTAEGLAADIGRHLRSEPVVAGPPTAGYRLRKFVRRNRGQVIAAGAVGAVLVLGVIGTSLGLMSALSASGKLAAKNAQLVQANEALGAAQESERRERVAAEEAAQKFSRMNDFLLGMLESADPYRTHGESLTVRQLVDEAVGELDGRFDGAPLVEADLREVLGRTYRRMGLYDVAETQIRRACALRDGALGPYDRATLAARGQLGRLLEQAGRYAEAEATLQSAYEDSRTTYGDEDIDTIQHLRHLGLVHYDQDRFDEALRVFQQVYDVRLRLLGEGHRKTLIALNDLAITYADMGDIEAAEPPARRYRELTLENLGPTDPETVNALGNLAMVYRDLGRYDEAERMLREARDMTLRIYGEPSREVCIADRNLGRLYQRMNRHDEALRYLERALGGLREILGDGHPATLSCTISLARTCLVRQEHERARDLFREGRDGMARRFGADDRVVREATVGLARCLLALDDCASARREIERLTTLEGLSAAVLEEHAQVTVQVDERCP